MDIVLVDTSTPVIETPVKLRWDLKGKYIEFAAISDGDCSPVFERRIQVYRCLDGKRVLFLKGA